MADYLSFALSFTLAREGGFSNQPADRGGPTNMGITQATLSAWRATKSQPAATVDDVKKLTVAEASDIYKVVYWDRMGGARFADPIMAMAVFDQAVLNGVNTSVRMAQAASNSLGSSLKVDGLMGPGTAAAINTLQRRAFIVAFCALVDARFFDIATADPTQVVFLDNWLGRSAKIRAMTLRVVS